MTRAITTVAVGERYLPYLKRLKDSLNGERLYDWRQWPWDSPTHAENHYAFKYWAIRDAIEHGHDQVMWLDSACYAVGKVDRIWAEIEKRGVYVIHGREPLGKWISDQALAHFGYTRDRVFDEKLMLCGGAIVGLDAREGVACQFLAMWGEIIDKGLLIASHTKHLPDRMHSLVVSDADENMIYSDDPRCLGHLSDEACFSLLTRQLGIETVDVKEWNETFLSGYNL